MGGRKTSVAAYDVTGTETIPKLPVHLTTPLKRTHTHNP